MRKKLFTYGMIAVLGSTLLITQPGCTSIKASETRGAATSSLKQAEENKEFITNGGFEDADLSAWNLSASDGIVKLSDKDVKEGVKVLHFWAEKGETFTVTQKIAFIPAGTYKLTAQSAGGDGETVSVIFNGQEGTDSQKDAGWCQYTQSKRLLAK